MSQTAHLTFPLRGDVELGRGFRQKPGWAKKTGAAGSGTHKFLRGLVASKDPADTTKDTFIIALAASVKPFLITSGYAFQPSAGQYLLTDAQGNIVSALETDTSFSGIYDGEVLLEFDGIVQPGDSVMPSAGNQGGTAALGHVQLWNGSSENTRIGVFQGLPGQNTGKYVATATQLGSLGWVKLIQ